MEATINYDNCSYQIQLGESLSAGQVELIALEIKLKDNEIFNLKRKLEQCDKKIFILESRSNYKKRSYKNSGLSKKTYLIKDNHNNLYKIGKSKNPTIREKTLQSEKPSIKIVKIWEKDIEKKLHNLYKKFRVRGEYFNLTNIQVKYICTHFK